MSVRTVQSVTGTYSIPPDALCIGKKVFLKPPSKYDEEEFMENQERSKAFLYPWIINKTGVSFYKSYLMRFEQKDIGHFVCSVKNGAIVGVININEIERQKVLKGSLGFYSFVQYARQGLLSEGMELVLERAFCKLGFSVLEANIQPENQSSKNFVQRHGFTQERFTPRYLKVAGRWIAHEIWILNREDWFLHARSNSK